MLSVDQTLPRSSIWRGFRRNIAKDNRQAANRVLDLIERRFQAIAKFPKIGAACPRLPTTYDAAGSAITAFFIASKGPSSKSPASCTAPAISRPRFDNNPLVVSVPTR